MAFAAPIVRQASFQRIFDGTNHYASGEHLTISLSTMSSDGKVVAFYGYNSDPAYRNKMFVHDVDSTDDPIEVDLAGHNIDVIVSNTGLVSNADGTRIFFVAWDNDNPGKRLFCRVNGKTGDLAVILGTASTNIEEPLDIATDAIGSHLYFN